MELSDLTKDERVALAALIGAVVESDGTASDDELAALQRVIDAVGADAYARAADTADERFPDEAALKAFLPSITRQDARELIYGAVLDAAIPEAMGTHESTLLEWLASVWNIAVHIEDE